MRSSSIFFGAYCPDAGLAKGRIGEKTLYFSAYGLRLRGRGDQSGTPFAYGLLQPSHGCDDHGDFEMVGYGTDSALGGAAIGQNGQVGGAEIGLDFGIPDI